MDTSICGYDKKEVYNSEQIAEDLDQHATKGNLQNNSKEQSLQNKISSEIQNNDYQPDHQAFMKVDLKEDNIESFDENIIEIENANNKIFVNKQCDVLDEDFGGYFCNEFKEKREEEGYFADSPLKICVQDSLLSFADGKDEKIIPNLPSNIEILPSSEDQAVKNLVLEPQFNPPKNFSLRQDEKIFEFSDQINIKKNKKSFSTEILIHNKVEFQSIHVPDKINSSYKDIEVKKNLIVNRVLKNEDCVEVHDIVAEGHIEKNTKYNSKDEIQKAILHYNEVELSEKLDSMIINESKSNCQVKNEAYQNKKNMEDNFREEKPSQKGVFKEIKEKRIISDNIPKIVAVERCEESYDSWGHLQLKEDEGEKQETEKSEKVLLPILDDGKTLIRKYVTEKQEVFENKQSEINGKNNLVNQKIINTISFQEIAETNDMNYRLNPNAKEFVPTSPPDFATLTNSYPIFQQRFDDVVAQSPRKSTINMEDIQVPEEEVFDKEAAIRPHEVNEEIIVSEHKSIQCGILCDYKGHSDDKCNNSKESLDVFEENMINSSVINSEDANIPVLFTAVQEFNHVDKSLSNYNKISDCVVEKYESDLLNSVQVVPDEDDTKIEKENASSEEIKVGNKKFNVELINKSKCPENFQQSIVEEINILVKGDCIAEHDGSNLFKEKFKSLKNKEICAKSNDFPAKPAVGTKQVFEKTNNQLGFESSKNSEPNKNKGAANSNLCSKKATPSVKDVTKSKPNLAISSKPKSNLLATQTTKVSITARPRCTIINAVVEKNTSQSNHLKTKINLKNNSTLLNKKTLTNNKHFADNSTLRTSVTTKDALLKNGTETKFPVPKSYTNTGKNKINETLNNEISSSLSKTSSLKTGNLKTSPKNPLAILAKTEAIKSVSKPGKFASRFAVNATKNLGSLKAGNPVTNCTVKKDTSQNIDSSMIRKFVSSAPKTTANTKSNTAALQSTKKNVNNIKQKTNDTTL